MTARFRFLIFFIYLFLPVPVFAHGGVDDGHLEALDYIELGGIILASLGLLAYSLDKWRKEKAQKNRTDSPEGKDQNKTPA